MGYKVASLRFMRGKIIMEHRKTKRVPANIHVLLYQRGLPAAVAVVRNISKSGMFVATDFDDIDVNQKVDVEFRLDGESGERHPDKWVKAKVGRKSPMGLGWEGADESDTCASEAA